MGFLSGSATFARYRIVEDPTDTFGKDHLDTLEKFRIGTVKTNLFEQPSVGYLGGAHLLDTDFDFEKNIMGDAMHFGIRIDSCQIPGPIKKAWMQIELSALTAENSGDRPTKAQRQEAKEAIEARCLNEAEQGHFTKMTEISVLWDAATETILLSSTSEKNNDMCLSLLERSFELKLSPVSCGKLAIDSTSDDADRYAALQDSRPTSFFPDEPAPEVVWWNGMADNFDFLGNEFLLWLWWQWETGSGTTALSDGSEVSGMFARSLSLDCPKGEFGKESISSDMPVSLPESSMAIRVGKLPRKAGLTLVRNGEQYDFSLQAETFSVSSAKISQPKDDSADAREDVDRLDSVRQLCETIDLLFESFCDQRIGKNWSANIQKMSKWLSKDPSRNARRSAAAA